MTTKNNGGVDYSAYTAQDVRTRQEWTPPISELELNTRSTKLAVSSRIYPEYLLACLAHLEQVHGARPVSLSELIYFVCCEYINQNSLEVPNAELSLEALIMRGWISSSHKENFSKITGIRQKQAELETRISAGKATLGEQYKYWKDIDPEKAEAILEQATQAMVKGLTEDKETEPTERHNPEREETIVDSNSGLAGAIPPPASARES